MPCCWKGVKNKWKQQMMSSLQLFIVDYPLRTKETKEPRMMSQTV